MKELVFELADEKTPGYLRRLMQANKFLDQLKSAKNDPEHYEKLIDFLMGFITEPGNKEEAREALLDATQEQYMELLNAVITGKANPTSPKPIETS